MKQAVTLTSLGTSVFEKALVNIRGTYAHLACNYPPGTMTPWLPDNFRGQATLELSNRYLMLRQHQQPSPVVPFQHGVDPNNVLARLAGDQYNHLEENRVIYYRMNAKYSKYVDNNSMTARLMHTPRFLINEPSIFQIGDLVEANFSIVAFPVNKTMHHMQMALRTLALVNGEQAMVR